MPRAHKTAQSGPRRRRRRSGNAASRFLRRALARLSASRLGRLALPTLGGRQFWSDQLVFAGWRIQQNVLTGHARLLDARNVRRAWGSLDHCLVRFEEMRARHRLRQNQKHLVVMVHGLFLAHTMFEGLGRWLARRKIASLGFTYASTRHGLADHARALCQVLARLQDVESVTFVTYSLGALVVRKAMRLGARQDGWRSRIQVRGLFMVAPPNRGARLAEVLLKRGPGRWLLKPVAADLMPARARRLPRPDTRYAIIAGGTGKARGFNPFLEGDNDGCVTVAETQLSVGDDLLVVKAPHSLLVNHRSTRAALARFLVGDRAAG